MALTLLAANNAESMLASAISESATSLIVSSGTGARFPDVESGISYFKLTITDAATGSVSEIVNVTARSGDIFTIERGVEETTPRSWLANDLVANMMTAETINIVADSVQQATIAAAQASESAAVATAAADNAETTLASTIKQTITFQDGGELHSALDRVSDGTYLYYWTGAYPVTVVPGSNINTLGGLGVGFWSVDGDALLRSALAQYFGFGNVGRAIYSEIRNYSGALSYLSCKGYFTDGDGAQGIFRYDPSDTTTSDNDCTVIVDGLGRRWKREFTGDIRAEWANMKTIDQTSDPQDTAFANCVLAAAAASDAGYPQRIIRFPESGTVKISQKHNIRCGVFSESDDYSPVSNMGGRFGLVGKICGVGDGEILIVQANSPYIELEIDNGGVSPGEEPVSSNKMIRLEAMVMNPHIDIKGYNYPGCVLYSTGKNAVSDISAIWPDLNTPLPSIQNLAYFAMRTNKCGQGFYLENTGSGFGHMDSVWEQLNTNASVLKAMYDVTVKSYEDFVAPLTLSGGLIIDTCGTITVDNLLIGSGGGPHVRIWDTPAITIKRIFSVNGGPTYSQTVPGQYALEICNSRVGIGLIDAYYPGEFLRTGYNAFVSIGCINGWYMCRVTRQVNDIAYLQYRGSRVGQVNDVSDVVIKSGCFYNLNYFAGGYPAQSLFYVDPSVLVGKLTLNDIEFRNTHSGWTGTTEAQTYIVEVKTAGNTFFFNSRNTKWDDNNFNYVIYLAKEYQLGDFQSSQTNFARIRYADGNQSTFGMRDAPHPDLGTTTPATDGSNWTYNYRRPGKYNGLLTVGSSSTVTVAVNGQTVFYANSAGTYPLNLKLYFQEIVTINITGSVTLGSSTWRYTV